MKVQYIDSASYLNTRSNLIFYGIDGVAFYQWATQFIFMKAEISHF